MLDDRQNDSHLHIENSVVRYLDGDLDAKEFEAFDERLERDPEARQAFIDLCLDATAIQEIQDVALAKLLGDNKREDGSESGSSDAGSDETSDRWPDPPLVFGAISFASILLLISGLAATAYYASRSDGTTGLAQCVARVSNVSGDCRRSDTGSPVHAGERLPADSTLRLASGNARLAFRSGASVVLHGPSEFSVVGPNEGHLASGHLIGRIANTSAEGFSIATPDGRVVDLGTEFAVRVDKTAGTSLEVFDGLVRFASKDDNAEIHVLEAGERMRLAATRFLCETPRGRPAFAELLTAVDGLEKAVLAEHPLAYWRFENAGDSPIVPDVSGNGHHGLKRNGATVSPIDGVVGGALELDGTDDYVEIPDSRDLNLGDKSLTILGWINARDTSREHPLLSSGEAEPDETPSRWSISLDKMGGFGAGLGLSPRRKTVGTAGTNDLRDGTWHQVVYVLDHERREHRYYIDGRLFSTSSLDAVPEKTPIRRKESLHIGMDAEFDCAKGYIDEVAVFPRVLSDDKIAALYAAAKGAEPYRPPDP